MPEYLATTGSTVPALVLQEYGAFTIQVKDENTLGITCLKGILANGVLYPFSGQMVRHETGWRFWAQTLVTPKLAPKARAAAVEVLTAKVNEYVEQHPDLFAGLVVRRWEQRLAALRFDIRQTKGRLVSEQTRIEQIQKEQADRHEKLVSQQRELQEHLANRPEGAHVPEED